MRIIPCVIVIATAAAACERDPSLEPPSPPPSLAPTATPAPAPAEVVAPRPAIALPAPDRRVVAPPPRRASAHLGRRTRAPSDEHAGPSRPPGALPLPLPPSDEPRAYAAWLRGLPGEQQQQIAAVCRAHRLDYQPVCGGIGPLHIPLPPLVRARASRPSDPVSLFSSMEAWSQSLTAAQRRFVDRACSGGEDRPSSDLCGDNTPLVVVFDDAPVAFTRGARFAFAPGQPTATDWPTAATPWIALDRDHDGAIASGAELFGSNTTLAAGGTAPDGFVALAELDANRDGVIDAQDPAFPALVLWADRDGDGRSSPAELTSLGSVIVAISLDNHLEPRCDERANCEGQRARFTWRAPRGELRVGSVVDVYLPRR